MRLDLWNEAKTLRFKVKEPLVLWYGFKGTTGACDTMTLCDDSQSSSAVLPQSGPLGQEPRGLDLSPPLTSNYPWDSEHSLPLWVSSSPCENKMVHWLWDTFLSRYHSQAPPRALFTRCLTTARDTQWPWVTSNTLSAGTCTLSSWKGAAFSRTTGSSTMEPAEQSRPGWNVSFVPMLLFIPSLLRI